jgi:hypothetical protein
VDVWMCGCVEYCSGDDAKIPLTTIAQESYTGSPAPRQGLAAPADKLKIGSEGAKFDPETETARSYARGRSQGFERTRTIVPPKDSLVLGR